MTRVVPLPRELPLLLRARCLLPLLHRDHRQISQSLRVELSWTISHPRPRDSVLPCYVSGNLDDDG